MHFMIIATVAAVLAATSLTVRPEEGRHAPPEKCASPALNGLPLPVSGEMLNKRGVHIAKSVDVISLHTVAKECAGRVAGVFSGGVVLDDGSSFESTPDGFAYSGGAKVAAGSACPPQSGFEKCIPQDISRRTLFGLSRKEGRSRIVALDGAKAHEVIATGDGAEIIDFTYRPSPDSSGGSMVVYLRTKAEGLLLNLTL